MVELSVVKRTSRCNSFTPIFPAPLKSNHAKISLTLGTVAASWPSTTSRLCILGSTTERILFERAGSKYSASSNWSRSIISSASAWTRIFFNSRRASLSSTSGCVPHHDVVHGAAAHGCSATDQCGTNHVHSCIACDESAHHRKERRAEEIESK
eukprot:CAMPEP_0180514492 /NCGR_PEP_ID=MMETSP1036_2-20121128/52759_1 /TAXON_ID=632150 /ORGANISM="Azadinium spinosum, Strain 3D9" /LENGTH=153 /DNA_ID=CAMNT_0022525919 /DNA_START=8 /DNA_END=469 /DNA_ORIENTATION=+